MDVRLEPVETAARRDEFQLLSDLWNIRHFVLLSTILAGLVLAGLIAAARIIIKSDQVFEHAIEFVFPGVQKGRYPNETSFVISDLVAPSVLIKVYEDNRLAKRGIKLDDFGSSITVEPYAPSYEATVKRYRRRLANRKLSFGEAVKIENEMRAELASMSSKNALLRFVYRSRLGLESAAGEKVVADIVAAWADISIKKRGVLEMSEALDKSALLDESTLKSVDFPIAIELMEDAHRNLLKRVKKLRNTPGAVTIVDEATGLTALSLKRRIDAIGNRLVQQIGISRDREWTNVSLQARIAKLGIEKEKYEELAGKLGQLRKSYAAQQFAGLSSGNGAGGLGGGSVMPQVGKGFLDKLMALPGLGKELAYMHKLVDQQIEAATVAIEIGKRIKDYQATLRSIASNDTNPTPILEDRLQRETAKLATELNGYWQVASRLFDQLSDKRFSYSGKLYRSLPVADTSVSSHFVQSPIIAGLFGAALMLAALIATLVGLARRRSAHRSA